MVNWQGFDGSGCGLLQALYWHLHGGFNHEKAQPELSGPRPRFKPSTSWIQMHSVTAGLTCSVTQGPLWPWNGAPWGRGQSNRLRRVAANICILNKQWRTNDKGWSFSLGIDVVGPTTFHRKQNTLACYVITTQSLGRILWNNLSKVKWTCDLKPVMSNLSKFSFGFVQDRRMYVSLPNSCDTIRPHLT
jgi:hypothetical protein